jgi:hypothetical protein
MEEGPVKFAPEIHCPNESLDENPSVCEISCRAVEKKSLWPGNLLPQ